MMKGRVYKIVNTENDQIYIGSTTMPITTRFSTHKWTAKYRGKTKLYKHMREVGEDKFSIEMIEENEFPHKLELRKREDFWIKELRPSLNTNNACVNPEERKAYLKTYRETNKEKIKAWALANKEKTKARLKAYYLANKEKKKAWYQANKEKLNVYHRSYRQKKIEAKEFHCECCDHSFPSRPALETHFRSKKHQIGVMIATVEAHGTDDILVIFPKESEGER